MALDSTVNFTPTKSPGATWPITSLLQTPTLPVSTHSPVRFEYSPNGIEQQLLQNAIDSSWFQDGPEAADPIQSSHTPSKFGPPRQLFQSPLESPNKAYTPKRHTNAEPNTPTSSKSTTSRSSKKRDRSATPISPTLRVPVDEMLMEPPSPTKRAAPLVLDTSTIDLTDSPLNEAGNTSVAMESDISTEIQLETEKRNDFPRRMDLGALVEGTETQDETQLPSQATPRRRTSSSQKPSSSSSTQPKTVPQLLNLLDSDAGFTKRGAIMMFAIISSPFAYCRYEDLVNFVIANPTTGDAGLTADQVLTDFKTTFRKLVNMKRLSKISKKYPSLLDRRYQLGPHSPLRTYNIIIPECWRGATAKTVVNFPRSFPMRDDFLSQSTPDERSGTRIMVLGHGHSSHSSVHEGDKTTDNEVGPTDAQIRDAINAAWDSASKSALDTIQHTLDTSVMQETMSMSTSSYSPQATLPLLPSLAPTLPLASTDLLEISPSNAPTQLLTESQMHQEHIHPVSPLKATQDVPPTLPLPSNLNASSTWKGNSGAQSTSSHQTDVEDVVSSSRAEQQAISSTSASKLESISSSANVLGAVSSAIASATQSVTSLTVKAQYDDNPFLAQAAARFAAKSKDSLLQVSTQKVTQTIPTTRTAIESTKSNGALKGFTTYNKDHFDTADSTIDEGMITANDLGVDVQATVKRGNNSKPTTASSSSKSPPSVPAPLLSSSSNLLKSVLYSTTTNAAIESLLRSAKQKRSFYSVSSSTTASTHSNLHTSMVNNSNKSFANLNNDPPLIHDPLLAELNKSVDLSSQLRRSAIDLSPMSSTTKVSSDNVMEGDHVGSQSESKLTRHASHGRDEFDRLHMSVHYSLVGTGCVEVDEDVTMLGRDAGTLEFDPDVIPYSSPSASPTIQGGTATYVHSSITDRMMALADGFGDQERDNEFIRFGLNSQYPHAKQKREIWTAIEDPDENGLESTQHQQTQRQLIDDIIESSQEELPSASMIPSIDDRDDLDRSMEAAEMPSQATQLQQQRVPDWNEFSSQIGALPATTSSTNLRNRFKSPFQATSLAHSNSQSSTQQQQQSIKSPIHNLQVSQNIGLSAKASKKGKHITKGKKSVHHDEMEQISDDERSEHIDREASQRPLPPFANHLQQHVDSSQLQPQQHAQHTEFGLDVSVLEGDGPSNRHMHSESESIEEFSVAESKSLLFPSPASTYSPYELVASAKKSISPFSTSSASPKDLASSPYSAGSSRSFLMPNASRMPQEHGEVDHIESVPSAHSSSSSTSNTLRLSKTSHPHRHHQNNPARTPFRLLGSIGNAHSSSSSIATSHPSSSFTRSRPPQFVHHTFVSPMGFSGGALESGLKATILATFVLPFVLSSCSRPVSRSSISLRNFKKNFSQAVADVEASSRAKRTQLFQSSAPTKFQLASVLANGDVSNSIALQEMKGKNIPRKRALAVLKANNRLVWIDLEPKADEIHPGQVISILSSRMQRSCSVSSTPLRTLLEDALSTLGMPTEEYSASFSARGSRLRLPAHLLQLLQPKSPYEYFPSSQELENRMEVEKECAGEVGVSAQVYAGQDFSTSKWAMSPCSLPLISIDRFQDRSAVSFRDIDDYTLAVCQDWSRFWTPRRVSVFVAVTSLPVALAAEVATMSTCYAKVFGCGAGKTFQLKVPSFIAERFVKTSTSAPPLLLLLLDFLLQDSPHSFIVDGFTHITIYDTRSNIRNSTNSSNAHSSHHVTLERRDASTWIPHTVACSSKALIKYKKSNSTSVCRESMANIVESTYLQLPAPI